MNVLVCDRCGWVRPLDCTCLAWDERQTPVKPPRIARAATKLPTPARGPANPAKAAEGVSARPWSYRKESAA